MFDNVGQDLDRERHRRQLIAVLITLGLCSAMVGSIVLYGIMMAVEKVMQVAQDEDMVEVVIDEPTLEAPPPPPPPPPPPSAAPEPEEEEEEKDPEEMDDEIKELDKEVEEEVKNDAVAASSDPAGVVGGQLGGVAGGVVGGVEGGVVGGQLGGVRTFHHSELEVKRRVMPEYPAAAKDMNLGDQDCKVRIFIDEEGAPYDVRFEACPKVFHDSARDAILKWRWYPAKVGGQKVKAQFLLNVKYKLTG